MLVFFVQKFNDIDHFTPVIYRIAKDTNKSIAVLCLNPFYDISNDFRLTFLKQKYDVHVDHLYNFHKPLILYKIFRFCLLTPHSGDYLKNIYEILIRLIKGKRRSFKKIAGELSYLVMGFLKSFLARFKILETHFVRNHYRGEWVEEMIERLSPSVLVFDHAATNRIANVRDIMDASRRRGIPTISMPHGIPLFVKHSHDYDRAKEDYINNQCDYLVLQHRWWKHECVEYGLDASRTTILGIARHCKEWERILQKIVPSEPLLENKGNGRLKVVYMDSGPDRYHEYKDIVQEAVQRIGQLNFVRFIYKPHTRRNIAHLKVPRSTEIAKDINSVNLIKWADVVVGMHSSIMIEALIQDTVYISPTYFRKRKMIYEEYEACWMVNSHLELEEALKKLKEEPTLQPYPRKNVERFLTDVVCNGEKDKDVLGDHKAFILDVAKDNMRY